jgi:putative ABC transport system permease protein
MAERRDPAATLRHRAQFIANAFDTAARSLWARRQRALLTALGIITGCMAFTGSSGVLWGRMESDLASWRRMGASFVSLSAPGLLRASHGEDLAAQTPGIVAYSPVYFAPTTVRTRLASLDVKAAGAAAALRQVVDLKTTAGRFFTSAEDANAADLCVVGAAVAQRLKLRLDTTSAPVVTLFGQPFRVVGILEPRKGNLPGGGAFDDTVIVPQATLKELAPTVPIALALFQAVDEKQVRAVAAGIRYRLRRMLGLSPLDRDTFELTQAADIIDRIEREYRVGGAVLLTVVCLTLLVGGIGVMNIMLVTVAERTPEIGLRKAVGARAKEILMQFLVESLCLCTLGGIIGTALGVGLAHLTIGLVVPDGQPIITPRLVLESIGFAVLTGVFFGFMPARRASQLSPIEALRRG